MVSRDSRAREGAPRSSSIWLDAKRSASGELPLPRAGELPLSRAACLGLARAGARVALRSLDRPVRVAARAAAGRTGLLPSRPSVRRRGRIPLARVLAELSRTADTAQLVPGRPGACRDVEPQPVATRQRCLDVRGATALFDLHSAALRRGRETCDRARCLQSLFSPSGHALLHRRLLFLV